MYAEREIDRVELVYNHFKSTASQVLRREEYLPLQVEPAKTKGVAADYIVEPSREEVIRTLVPQVLSLKIFTMLLDSNAPSTPRGRSRCRWLPITRPSCCRN